MKLLGHMLHLFLIFWAISMLFSMMAKPVYIHTSSVQRFLFLHVIFSTCFFFTCCSLCFDCSHSGRYKYGFDLYFPVDLWWWTSFYVSVGYLYVFFGKMSLPVFCPFFNYITCFVLLVFFWCCLSSLYIFGIKPLTGWIVGKYLLLFSGLSCFVDGFLHCAKGFYFSVVPVFCFCFCFLALGDIHRKMMLRLLSEGLLPVFSSRSSWFQVSHLGVCHIWVYFCVWCTKVIQFHSFACSYLVFPTPFFKEIIFSPLYILGFLCHRLIEHVSVDLVLG